MTNTLTRTKRVFDLRLYQTSPGKEEAFKVRWRDHAARIYARHGMESIGWWQPVEEKHKQLFVTLLANESLEAINRSIGAFHKDEEWIRLEKETEKDGKLRTEVISYRMTPTDFSKLR